MEYVTLRNGVKMPILGYGVLMPPRKQRFFVQMVAFFTFMWYILFYNRVR